MTTDDVRQLFSRPLAIAAATAFVTAAAAAQQPVQPPSDRAAQERVLSQNSNA